jgi:hypothetical protein
MSESNVLPKATLHDVNQTTLSVNFAVSDISKLGFTANADAPITAVSGEWVWYTRTGYTGDSGVVNPNAPIVGEMTLFDQPGQSGNSRVLHMSTKMLDDFDKITRSILVVIGMWKLYTEECFKGEEITVGPGDTLPVEFRLSSARYIPPKIQSVQPYVRAGQIILYENTGYSGSSLPLYASANTLVGSPHHFNDKAHSVRVVSGKWKLSSNVRHSGAHKIYTGPCAVSQLPAGLKGSVSSVELLR